MRSLQAKGIKISICEATSSIEWRCWKERSTSHDIYFHIESTSSRPKEKSRCSVISKLPPSSKLFENRSFGSRQRKCLTLPPYLSKSGYFSTRGCSTRNTVSISSIYRLVLSNKPKFRDSREFPNAPFRSFVYTRGGIESDLVVKKDLTSRGNLRVTIITSKCGGTPKKRFYHAWIYKGEKIIVSCVS